MGQRQRGGDGGAAGSRGAAVPTSPCPRGAAKLRGGDVPGPASPLAHKPRASSKELLLLWGDHKTGACRVCPHARSQLAVAVGCGEALGGSSRPRGVGFQLAATAAPVPAGIPSTVGLRARCPGDRGIPLGPWNPLGAVGSPFWGRGLWFSWVHSPAAASGEREQQQHPTPQPCSGSGGTPRRGSAPTERAPGGAVGGAEGAGPPWWGAQGASGAPLARAEPRCPAPAAVPTGPPITRLLPNRT